MSVKQNDKSSPERLWYKTIPEVSFDLVENLSRISFH